MHDCIQRVGIPRHPVVKVLQRSGLRCTLRWNSAAWPLALVPWTGGAAAARQQFKASDACTTSAATCLFELVAQLLPIPRRLQHVVQPLKAVGEAQGLQAQQLEAPARTRQMLADACRQRQDDGTGNLSTCSSCRGKLLQGQRWAHDQPAGPRLLAQQSHGWLHLAGLQAPYSLQATAHPS